MNCEMNIGETWYTNLDHIVLTNNFDCIDKNKVYVCIMCIGGGDSARYPIMPTNYRKLYPISFVENGIVSHEYKRGDRTIRFEKQHPNGLKGIISKRGNRIEQGFNEANLKERIVEFLKFFMTVTEE